MQLLRKDRFGAGPLILGVAVSCAVLVAGFSLWRSGPSLPQAYRYPFSSSLSAKPGQSFQNEVAFYQARIRQNPGDGMDSALLAGVYLGKARASGQSAWYLLAQGAAERSLEALPFYNTGAELVLAEVAQAQHDFSGALEIVNRILKEKPGDKGAKSLQVTIFMAQGRVGEAANLADELVGSGPTSSNLSSRALTEIAQGKDQAAIADFERALSTEQADNPYGSAWTRTMLGRLFARRGELELAKGLFEEALRISKNPLSTLYLADVETRLGRYRLAERHYNDILAMGEGSASLYDHAALRGLARVARLENRADADDLYSRSEAVLRREVAGGAFGHRRELAGLLLERGQAGDVGEALKQARLEAQSRQDWETLEVLAWALYKSGQYADAQKAVQQAMKWGIRDAGLFYRAAQIEQALGNDVKAQKYVVEAQKTDPHLDAKMRGLLGLK